MLLSVCSATLPARTTATFPGILDIVHKTGYLILNALPLGSVFLFIYIYSLVVSLFIVRRAKTIQRHFNFTKFAKKVNNNLDKWQI